MKTFFSLFLAFFFIDTQAQDIRSLQKIDSLVGTISRSKTKPERDSIIQNMPDLGLTIKTYLTMLVEGDTLKKYINYVETTRVEGGVSKEMLGCNSFYFSDNSLIKVEEVAIAENQAMHFNWYFQNGKCLYHSLQSETADSRADLLLSMAEDLKKTLNKHR